MERLPRPLVDREPRISLWNRLRSAINDKQDAASEETYWWGTSGTMLPTTDPETGLRFIAVSTKDLGLNTTIWHEKQYGDEHRQTYQLAVYDQQGRMATLHHRQDGSFTPYPLSGRRTPDADWLADMVTSYERSVPSELTHQVVAELLAHGSY